MCVCLSMQVKCHFYRELDIVSGQCNDVRCCCCCCCSTLLEDDQCDRYEL